MTEYEVVDDVSDRFNGVAKHIRLPEPVKVTDWDDETKLETRDFVVSAANVMLTGPETYVFPADEDGEVKSWGEVETSRKGTLDWEEIAEKTAEVASDGVIGG